jgi:hypothetical protein
MKCGPQKEENDQLGKAHLEMRPYKLLWSMTFDVDHLQVFECLAKKYWQCHGMWTVKRRECLDLETLT